DLALAGVVDDVRGHLLGLLLFEPLVFELGLAGDLDLAHLLVHRLDQEVEGESEKGHHDEAEQARTDFTCCQNYHTSSLPPGGRAPASASVAGRGDRKSTRL